MYINLCIWNLKKLLYRLSYLQSRNRHADVENKSMDGEKVGKGMENELGNWD